MVTRPALDRFRPGIIACESSSVNFRGQLPTLPRNTATGIPGASTDLATMKSVSPVVALAAKPAANVTSPVTATPDAAAADPAALVDADPVAADAAPAVPDAAVADAGDFESPANDGNCFARAFDQARRRRQSLARERETLADWAVICDDIICSSQAGTLKSEDPRRSSAPGWPPSPPAPS